MLCRSWNRIQGHKRSRPISLLFFALIGISVGAYCQDTLESFDFLVEKARQFQISSPDSSLYYYEKALSEAERSADKMSVAKVKSLIASVHASSGDHALARKHYLHIIHAYGSGGYDKEIRAAYSRIGIMYRAEGQLDSSMHWFRKLEEHELTSGYTPGTVSSYGLIGSVYDLMDNPVEAERYNLKEKERAFSNDDHIAKVIALYELARWYKSNGDLEKFGKYLEEYRKLIDFTRFDERTLAFHLEGLFTDDEGNLSIEGLESLITSLKRMNFAENLILIHGMLGNQYLKLSQFEKAISNLNESISIADSIGYAGLKLFPLSKLSRAYEQSGRLDEALAAQRRLHNLIVELNNEESRKTIDELKVKYGTEQKERELLENQIEIKSKTHQRNILLSASFVLLLLGGLFSYNFWMRNRKNQQISTQETILQKQKIEALERENKILAMDAMINGQEEERKRIAKDLHDGLGGILSTVKLSFESIQKEVQRLHALQPYEKAINMLDDACEEVRRIAHDMMPGALTMGGLPDAIRDLGDSLKDVHAIDTDIQIIGMEKHIGDNKEIMLYRIAQELVTNVIKHAEADKVIIQLSRFDGELMLTVEDNGKGFDTTENSHGLGLRSVKSRVDYLNGELDINTSNGEGTMVSIRTPL